MIEIYSEREQRNGLRVWFRCFTPGCDLRGDATLTDRDRAVAFVGLLNEAHTHTAADTESGSAHTTDKINDKENHE